MTDEKPGSTTLTEDWHDFTQDFSMHGVRLANMKTASLLRRSIWLVLILVCLGYFFYAAIIFMNVYTKGTVNTKIRVETAEELKELQIDRYFQFPTVTVCNRNMWALNAVTYAASTKFKGSNIFDVMQDLFNPARPSPPPADKYNWSSAEYIMLAEFNSTKEFENFLRLSSHPLDLSVKDCMISGEKYDCKDVFEIVPTDAGYCLQLNSNGSLQTAAAGRIGGISFLLDTLVEQYTTGPFSSSEGFMLTFQDVHEVPLVVDLSSGLTPGILADIMLHKTSTNRKPPPADDNRANCFDTDNLENPLHYYKNYSYSACQVECKTSYVINKCGCRQAFQPAINGTKSCLFQDMLFCSVPAMRSFPSDPKGLRSCKCKDACKVSEYTPKITTTKFPSTNFAREFPSANAVEAQGYTEEHVNYIAKNKLVVNIYYGKMSYQRLDEEFAYSVDDMISNLGGTLGLCVGTSILTICELIEFGVRAFSKRLTTRAKPTASHVKVAPDVMSRMD